MKWHVAATAVGMAMLALVAMQALSGVDGWSDAAGAPPRLVAPPFPDAAAAPQCEIEVSPPASVRLLPAPAAGGRGTPAELIVHPDGQPCTSGAAGPSQGGSVTPGRMAPVEPSAVGRQHRAMDDDRNAGGQACSQALDVAAIAAMASFVDAKA